MTWLDSMVEDGELESQKQQLGFTSQRPAPRAFDNAGKALAMGTLRGGFKAFGAVSSLVNDVAGSDLETSLAIGGSYFPDADQGQRQAAADYTEQSSQEIGQKTAQATMSFTPDPNTTGSVGMILSEAADVLPRTIVGAALAGPVVGALAAGVPAGYATKQVGLAQGLDESTATWKGVIEGTTLAIGAVLPAARFAPGLLDDAAIAIGSNVGLGVANRAATSELLARNGYTAQAAQYRAFDTTALLTDAILGAAFFGIGRVGMHRPTTDQIDAALTARNSQHADIDTAPGLPVDPRSAVAHQDALRAAINSINRGEPVVLPDNIQSASFLRAGDESPVIAPSRDQALASAREELLPVVRAEAEQAAAGSLPNVRDIRAELATVSKALDDLDSTFRAKAKEFQGQGLGRKKAEQSARKSIAEERSQLAGRKSEMNDSLAGNRSAEQARAELNALDRGELPARFDERFNARADEIIQGFQRKPLADGVAAAKRTMTPRQINERDAREEIDTLVREYEATLPREPVAAPAPKPDLPLGGKPAAPKVATPDKPGPEVVSGGGKPDGEGKPATRAEPVELQLLRDSVNRNPDTVVNSGFDADGMPLQAKAADVLADIEAEHRLGVRESQSYMAAITCMLRGFG
ncbi:hypothetical protein VSQ82_14000 [Pseudomonas sp. MS-1(2024)]|uniref:hypothetical protein n=1 Tax=Pseudomonas sp. MS-1(2024) TaxID=3112251 RepID=UPI002DBB6BB1|nr:hypothetical protein [Pseudomonas sp. MS-1(2024)]MEC4168342.1 hypothetical protein [Pseudomonas sp. MS-1(2024)]